MKHLAKQFEFPNIRTISMRTDLKRNPTYEDTDLMTFGKHKGLPLSDVPAPYFRWLWDEGPTLRTYSGTTINPNAQPPMELYNKIKLANYIWNSHEALAQELGEEFI